MTAGIDSGDEAGGRREAPAGSGRRPPAYVTSFVGRRAELADLTELLGAGRLLTITGPGGCGKTRLAREALVAGTDRWSDGVCWADLGALSDPAQVGGAVAAAVGVLVEPSIEPTRALVRQIGDGSLAVCLDCCEHLLDACAELVAALITECPAVTVVATSREPLGMPGETVWRVPSMVEAEAVALFVERGQAIRRSYTADECGLEAVRTVCRRLDGIPLAIELAAAQVRMFTAQQIAAALDDRFRFLVSNSRGVIPRQQTLAASVGWSYDLLHDEAQVLLRRLAVFVGGFTLDAVEAVCADEPLERSGVLAALGRLVDASMVHVDERDGLARYRLLETVREYAMERSAEAGETEQVRARHLAHFVDRAERAARALDHDDQDVVLDRLETDHDNLRAALDWALGGADPGRGRRLAAALSRLWFLHGHAHEGLQRLQRAIDLAVEDTSNLQGQLVTGLALLGLPAGRPDLLAEGVRRAVEIGAANGDDQTLARAHAAWSYFFFYSDAARCEQLACSAQRHAAAAGDVFAADLGLLMEACSLMVRDRFHDAAHLARTLFERSWPRRDRFCASIALLVEREAALFTGDVRRAVAVATESVRTAAPLNDYLVRGTTMVMLASAMGLNGDLAGARRLMATVLRSFEAAGPDVDVVNVGMVVGRLQLWSGDVDAAARTYEQVARKGRPGSDSWMAARGLAGLARSLRHLGRRDEAAIHAETAAGMGRRVEAPSAIAEALDESAHLAADEDPGRAAALHYEALQIRVDHDMRTFIPDSLDALARLAAGDERFAEAVRLLAASANGREQVGYPRPLLEQPAIATTLHSARPALGQRAFDDAWCEGSSLSLDDAVAYASRTRGPRQRPQTGWASLTPTERRVVALVAQGLTNAEAGQRLFVNRETVKTHLAHVYAKLGVANRVQLTSLVRDRRNP